MPAKVSQNELSINILLITNGLFYTDRYIYGNKLFLHFTFENQPLTAFRDTGKKAFASIWLQTRKQEVTDMIKAFITSS
jgi:hypothetical protein